MKKGIRNNRKPKSHFKHMWINGVMEYLILSHGVVQCEKEKRSQVES